MSARVIAFPPPLRPMQAWPGRPGDSVVALGVRGIVQRRHWPLTGPPVLFVHLLEGPFCGLVAVIGAEHVTVPPRPGPAAVTPAEGA